ncbi:hypothetical protein [Buchnera aphidicola]|uniref:Uncharacterized protein n=1 Tax=Buchnera aphidicola (Artemisaphis artemisicola) TaxID=1241836 RepID=A0A4D6XG42_9GAMM|nr:hypothetical protein [Buchnera aphidicola]QCI16226.1 hypothetical protein D9V59_02935 [Buchnera aphidicola (Artemisaphis artemisicola)]
MSSNNINITNQKYPYKKDFYVNNIQEISKNNNIKKSKKNITNNLDTASDSSLKNENDLIDLENAYINSLIMIKKQTENDIFKKYNLEKHLNKVINLDHLNEIKNSLLMKKKF